MLVKSRPCPRAGTRRGNDRAGWHGSVLQADAESKIRACRASRRSRSKSSGSPWNGRMSGRRNLSGMFNGFVRGALAYNVLSEPGGGGRRASGMRGDPAPRGGAVAIEFERAGFGEGAASSRVCSCDRRSSAAGPGRRSDGDDVQARTQLTALNSVTGMGSTVCSWMKGPRRGRSLQGLQRAARGVSSAPSMLSPPPAMA
jgi:hypothetical protein